MLHRAIALPDGRARVDPHRNQVPRIGVIVPCRNDGRFLDDLLTSLEAQTLRDFETIIVDDGSTDPATVERLGALGSAIRVVRQANRRLPAARNRGFREARAEFVLPLDCDDMLAPTFLEETLRLLGAAPPDVGFVFTDVRLAGALDGIIHRHCHRFDQLFVNHLSYCMLVRKSAWEAVGGYDETMRDGMEDWDFNIRLLRAGFRGLGIAKPLMIYRFRPDGMFMRRTVRMHGTVWRQIRTTHRDLYRPRALAALWRSTRRDATISVPKALVLLGGAKMLPEAWFNMLFHRLLAGRWRRRLVRGRY
jgi:glycosyltransferase involved in cell wall biosynthesis